MNNRHGNNDNISYLDLNSEINGTYISEKNYWFFPINHQKILEIYQSIC